MVFCYLQAYGYLKIGITLCPSEWYQYLNFWYLAHGLLQEVSVTNNSWLFGRSVLYSSKIRCKFVWKFNLCASNKDLDIINTYFASESSGKSVRRIKYFKIRKSISSFKGNLPNSALQALFVALPF